MGTTDGKFCFQFGEFVRWYLTILEKTWLTLLLDILYKKCKEFLKGKLLKRIQKVDKQKNAW